MNHVMLDVETLGTSADACILSIGAVKFDLESTAMDDAGFYASISVESNLSAGRRIQESTLLWWLNQDKAAQDVFHEAKQTLQGALSDLDDWLGAGEYMMWSNGADFDLPMVAHAYITNGLEVPWSFWRSRCVRTYKNLPGAKDVKLSFPGVKHNALADAVYQAKLVQAIHAKLFKKTKATA